MEKATCCNRSEKALFFPCSGASNVGQASNQAVLELVAQGRGSMSCLAGLGADLPQFKDLARASTRVIAVDGCPVACAAKIFARHGIEPWRHLVLTEHGLSKRPGSPVGPDETARAVECLSQVVG